VARSLVPWLMHLRAFAPLMEVLQVMMTTVHLLVQKQAWEQIVHQSVESVLLVTERILHHITRITHVAKPQYIPRRVMQTYKQEYQDY
jgi:hypothetical protein